MTGEELFLNELNFHIRQGVSKKDLTDLINGRIKQLTLTDVGSSNKVDYKQGFELAKTYIDESPCDPDIYKEQLTAWDKYQLWLKHNELT